MARHTTLCVNLVKMVKVTELWGTETNFAKPRHSVASVGSDGRVYTRGASDDNVLARAATTRGSLRGGGGRRQPRNGAKG